MKQKLFLLVLVMFAFGMQNTVSAQDNRKANVERRANAKLTSEQRIDRQTTYIAGKLMLDDTKKAQFTSVYKKYLTEMQTCQKQWRTRYSRLGKKDSKEVTDKDIELRIEGRFAQAHKILDIRERYYNEFKKILKPRQIQEMYKAEKGIQNKVRKEIGRRKNIKRNRTR